MVLADIGIGLGAVNGYSGDDLTNPRSAALRGEIPYVPSGAADAQTRPLELRIHGVGGAPAPDNLECPATLQVAGDDTAGFHRPWYPGGQPNPDEPRREAYCWGKLNYRSWTRALWLLLVAYMIVNVAHFALPRRGPRVLSRVSDTLAKSLLRLVALAITFAFMGTTITVLADLVAWQAAPRSALPSWARTFEHLGSGPRLADALLAVLLVLAGLTWLSRSTATAYERWDGGDVSSEDTAWPLTRLNFWRGEQVVSRQRHCHVIAGASEVVFIAAMPHSSLQWLRVVLVVVAGVLAAFAIGVTASNWTDRDRAAGIPQSWVDAMLRGVGAGAVVLAVAAAAARLWWRPQDAAHALPGSEPLQSWIVLVTFGLLLVLGVVVVIAQPWNQLDVMGAGCAGPLLATLAVGIATVFGAAFTSTIANLLGSPQVIYCSGSANCPDQPLYLPPTVTAGSFGVVAVVISGAVFAVVAAVHLTSHRDAFRTVDVPQNYPPGAGGAQARDEVARTWAGSSLTDLAAAGLTIVAIPTAVVVAGYLAFLVGSGHEGWHVFQTLSTLGALLGVVAVGYFLVQVRAAFLNAASRKRFGFLWDVGTFFPRACAPFGPPCYAERAVPEIVTRIRRVVGDVPRGDRDPALAMQNAELAQSPADPREAHTRVLLVGYSQGTPISVAVCAQLPPSIDDRVALLTLAAPVRRLYGRTFPAYFGPHAVAILRTRRILGEQVRWRNLVRRSDYIGGWVIAPPPPPYVASAGVDRQLYDPAVLWDDDSPTTPPTHRHSDWFPDPQTRPYADALADQLCGPVP